MHKPNEGTPTPATTATPTVAAPEPANSNAASTAAAAALASIASNLPTPPQPPVALGTIEAQLEALRLQMAALEKQKSQLLPGTAAVSATTPLMLGSNVASAATAAVATNPANEKNIDELARIHAIIETYSNYCKVPCEMTQNTPRGTTSINLYADLPKELGTASAHCLWYQLRKRTKLYAPDSDIAADGVDNFAFHISLPTAGKSSQAPIVTVYNYDVMDTGKWIEATNCAVMVNGNEVRLVYKDAMIANQLDYTPLIPEDSKKSATNKL
jgi:hypothetical protein